MKRKLSLILAAVLTLSLAACTPSEPEAPGEEQSSGAVETPVSEAAGSEETTDDLADGTYTATAQGFGGEVSVTISVVDGAMAAVDATGDSETPGIGSNAIERLPGRILEAGDTSVDGVAGATITSDAIKLAAGAALAQAGGDSGAEVADVSMAPGTYTGHGDGYDWIKQVEVAVTVTENAITDIQVTDAQRETPPIFRSAEERMIPRILEHQSVAIDAVVGATASSNGIRLAVADALTQALVAGGSDAGDIRAFQTPPEKSTAQETIQVEVLVVGMGGSGSATAMSTAEAMYARDPGSVSVLAIDKAGKFGGTSANAGEPLGVNAPRYKEEFNGGQDYMDGDAMRTAWEEYTMGDAKMEVVDLFLQNSGETIDWLYYDHGFLLNKPLRGFSDADIYECKYQYVFRGNAEEGRDYGEELDWRPNQVDKYFQRLIGGYTDLGGEYLLETEAYALLQDADGKVTGVKARGYDGTEYTINAGAVVLATGGFGGSGEMMETYLSNDYYPLKGVWGTYGYGMAQNDGKMLQAAIDLGANTWNIDMPPMVHFVTSTQIIRDYPVYEKDTPDNRYGYPSTWSLNDVPMNMTITQQALQVDPTGKRYANEAEQFVWWKAGPTFFSIWSEGQVEEIAENGFSHVRTTMTQGQGGFPADTPIPEIHEILDTAIQAGYVYKADTLEELARLTGMDAGNLAQSVELYNQLCEAGEDTQYGKPEQYLWGLGEEGPYYAFHGASVMYSTCGGLDIDDQLRVLDTSGVPIQGLYAVGTDSMGVLYSNQKPYVTFGGAALGWAYTSGRLAGGILVEYTTGN